MVISATMAHFLRLFSRQGGNLSSPASGVDEAGVFHKIPHIDDTRLAEIFAREVLAFLVGKELLSPDYLEFIARVTLHIPDKGQVMVRYYGL